jgi:hypothetical protein
VICDQEKPAIVVTGRVRSVGGLNGWPKASDGSTLVLLLTPWMRGDQPKPLDCLLRIVIPVPEPEVARMMKTFESGSTVELALAQLDGPKGGRCSGRGRLPVRRVEPSPTLEAFRRVIDRPAALEDPKLGRLTLEPGAIIAEYNDQQAPDSFVGRVHLGREVCELSIELTRGSRSNTRSARARDRRDIARAAALVGRFDKGFEKLLGGIVREVLPVYDKDWRGGRQRLTAAAFRQRLVPRSISVWSNGAARLVLDTGDLFERQVIQAHFDKTGVLSKTWLSKWK